MHHSPKPQDGPLSPGPFTIPDDRREERKSSVQIVDRSSDSRNVLRTILQYRGIETLEATGAEEGLALARQHHPSLIVLDLESAATDPQRTCEQYDRESRSQNAPLVLLGALPDSPAEGDTDRLVQKPYHYGPLIRKIEQLLTGSSPV